mmetsp:Transcript_29997/g.26567  ORF Transcript_29997/g.26567 Transcript_29997/m.26567 type:complete len:274 (-) Transcript_29997:1377-2198(-)
MVIIDKANNSHPEPFIYDSYSIGWHRPKENDDNIYQVTNMQFKDGIWDVTIQRPMDFIRGDRDETIEVDKTILMNWAYHEGRYKKHTKGERGLFSMRAYSKSQNVEIDSVIFAKDMYYKLHAIFFYIAWSILTFILIVSGRFMRHLYNFRMIIHASTGLLITLNTVIMVIFALTIYVPARRPVTKYKHNPLGISVMVISIIQTVGGLILQNLYSNLKWNSMISIRVKKFHQIVGYILIIISNAQVVTGLYLDESPVKNLIYVHFIVFILMLIG